MVLLGGINAWGQTDFSGVWYIANETNHDNADIETHWYLVPGADPHQPHYADAYFHNEFCNKTGKGDYTGDNYGDPEKPFLTTYKTSQDLNSIWIVVSTGDGNYNIIHAKTGKYIVYEPPYKDAKNRKSMHLESTSTPGDNAKFAITGSLSGPINIRPVSVTSGNRFFNPAVGDGNTPQYYGTGDYFHAGMIGLYSDNTGRSQWYFENASSATTLTPVISDVDETTNTFTITSPAVAFSSIRYTTDGSTPPDVSTGTTTTSGSPITVTDNWTVQAVGVFGSYVTPLAGPKNLEPAPCATPVIIYDNTTSKVSITCATAGTTIYYTTDGIDPTASSTEYSGLFSITSPTTVKAIATHATFATSSVAELAISQVATPTIQNNGSNAISITTTTPGATIYYTTDGSTPNTSSTQYTGPLTDNVSNVTIKAIAVKEGMITSAVVSGTVKLQCATPVISRVGLTFTLSCSNPSDATLYYTLGGGSEVAYTGTPVSFTSDQLPMTVTAVARHSDYTESESVSMELINGSGTTDDPYLIYGTTDFTNFVTNVNNGTTASACYKLGSDVSASGMTAITTEFTGTFDGNGYTISNLGHALFNIVNGGTVKNVILDNINIDENENGNAGAICCEATGDTRIYNCGVLASSSTVEKDEDGYDKITSCSSNISGSNYVGSIVGLLDGSSRVINCFSYANVSGGSEVGGIIGHNNVATTAANLKTMVMNCMFYGEVSGTSIAPIYNGEIITNDGDANGVNNFNYFRLEASYIQNTEITKVYNCALGAETRFLQRFEFFRYLLNSNRELAAWWATGDATNKDEMKKWVMEPSQIGTSTPYPILKSSGKYASVVNYTPSETAYDEANRNKGCKLTSEGSGGVLHVTIQMGSGGAQYTAPSGAGLKSGETGMIDLNITDKDFEHFNFNYGKVQLPYYNDYCDGNYTENRVVTGWKITSINGGTTGNYSTGDDVTYTSGELTATPYNFADRKCTDKDKYSVSGRVFNQGAYWDVPEGVTAITIEPYWGKAVYLSDAYWDVVYKNGTGGGTAAGTAFDAMTTAANVPDVGGGQRYNTSSTFNGQTVFTLMSNAISSSNKMGLFYGVNANNHTVYDYAVVLVGNYHHTSTPEASNSKPYTVTSVDLDGDNEPDYSLMLRFNGRTGFHPVRYDFLNLIGLGMAQKSTGGIGSYNLGIIQPKAWFEVTNTALFRVTQFEYSPSTREKKLPIILQGGVIEQWVALQNNPGDRVSYFHVGGNVWFKEFHRGSHQDNAGLKTPHPPVSVTGGDYNKFYLTGLYQSQAGIYDDNAECYINGGRFGEVAGAGMEGIGTTDGKGNITWVIDNADMKEFYGGGINFAKPVHGNIHTIISNSHVDQFCGGPKFGDMESERTVITTATGCTFGTYFGAGFGGNSYNRFAPPNRNNVINLPGPGKVNNVQQNLNSWNDWVGDAYTQSYSSTYGGVSTQIDYQFIPMSSNIENVARLWVEFVNFSLATCHNVTSTLDECTITGNFYGGGSLGKVEGNVTSSLTNCKVTGSVYGAGFSASLPTVEVMNTGGFQTEPYFYEDLGTYRTAVFPTTTTYTWQKGNSISIDTEKHILYTTADLTTLGTVTGNVSLTIDGNTTLTDGKVMTVAKSVYGGGEESGVDGNTTVSITGGTIGTTGKGGATYGNVYGGGKGKEGEASAGLVKGNANVTISGTPTILHNIYGGGAYGSVGTFTYDGTTKMPMALATKNTGACTVTITGGTIGSNGNENGMVFGSSRGDVATPGTDGVDPNDRLAWVYSTHITIGDTGVETKPWIRGSVYGSGENGHTFQNTIVDIKKGTIGITTGETIGDYSGAAYPFRGNVFGGGCGTDTYWIDANDNTIVDEGEEHYNPLAGIVRGSATVNITGGQVVHNVYGAGAMGSVGNTTDATSGKTTVNISGGRIGYDGERNGNVFGAARGEYGISIAASNLANVRESEVNICYATTPASDNEGKTEQLITGSVFGGGESGLVKGSVAVQMTGGLILKDIYGGGALADTQTSNWDASANSGAGDWTAGEKSASTTTTVRLTGGTILGEAYGGGLGEAGKPAYVYGDVLLDLNGTTTSGETGTAIDEASRGCVVHEVFGCNNANGTPMGQVLVHVYATQHAGKSQIANSGDVTDAKTKGDYDIKAVYGGGNLAAYEPAGGKNTTYSTNVIIDGCGLTSIQQVYGGGNAASTPATNVTVNGTYEIEELFGGGNGKDAIGKDAQGNDIPNPGANVGFKDYSAVESTYDTKEKRQTDEFVNNYVYGTGAANVNIFGGTIHRVFGGSNTKGNVRQTAVTMLEEAGGCDFCVEEAYGGGKSAPMDAEAKLLMACIPGLSAAYGGAEAADIQGNVTLNITNGTFNRVFGGNNKSGTIRGSITVNVEEVGCRPIIIGELYGGGNEAGYSVYGYDSDGKPIESGTTPLYEDPQVNVMSFTSIGNIYGGGYGSGATMVANPTVNVNVFEGAWKDYVGESSRYEEAGYTYDATGYKGETLTIVDSDGTTTHDVNVPSHAKGKMGAINNIFGGGNAAKVIGNTYLNIATLDEVYVVKQVDTDFPDGYYTRNNDGTYTAATGSTAQEGVTYYEKKDVKGVDIRGDVFGGGNQAEVTGNAKVQIGKKNEGE